MIFRHCYKNIFSLLSFKRSSSCLFVEFQFRVSKFLNTYLFFCMFIGHECYILCEETVLLYAFPSVLIISLFVMLKKICCNFKKRRCIFSENMPLF